MFDMAHINNIKKSLYLVTSGGLYRVVEKNWHYHLGEKVLVVRIVGDKAILNVVSNVCVF